MSERHPENESRASEQVKQVQPTSEVAENVRVGYQVAAQLWAYEGQIAWSAFNAMLVASSIIAYAAFSSHCPSWRFWLHVAGLVLCILWSLLTCRMFSVHNYRVWATRELEETYLAPQVKTVSQGAAYHSGKPVKFPFFAEAMSLPCWARFRVSTITCSVIVLFAVIHVVSACCLCRIRECVP